MINQVLLNVKVRYKCDLTYKTQTNETTFLSRFRPSFRYFT